MAPASHTRCQDCHSGKGLHSCAPMLWLGDSLALWRAPKTGALGPLRVRNLFEIPPWAGPCGQSLWSSRQWFRVRGHGLKRGSGLR